MDFWTLEGLVRACHFFFPPNEFFQCIILNDFMVTILKEYEIKWRWGWVNRLDRLERR